MENWRKYPFLTDTDNSEYLCAVLDGTLAQEEKDKILKEYLSAKDYQDYILWKSRGRGASTLPTRETSFVQSHDSFLDLICDDMRKTLVIDLLEQGYTEDIDSTLQELMGPHAYNAFQRERTAPTVSKEDFLQLLATGVRNLVEKKIAIGDYVAVETLLGPNLEAQQLFKKWKTGELGRSSSISQPGRNSQRQFGLTNKVRVPYDRVKSLKWQNLFDKLLKKMRLDCIYESSIENGNQVITVRGEPKKVIQAVLEVWAYIAKTMTVQEHLPQWYVDMIKKEWDAQKRISFMGKCYVDLWVGEEYGYDFVQINAWSPEEMQLAKEMLKEEWEKIFNRKNGLSPRIHNMSKFPPVLNILILGQSGVGKSTFVNSVANYLMNKTFDESLRGELKILVKFHSSMIDEEGIEHHVKMESTECDEDDDNERIGNDYAGQSATQRPKSYVLEYINGEEKRTIRLIDTPGVLDTDGVDRDTDIMNQNMAYLANFSELHAVLILMNPNEARLTPGMKFCVNALLCRLHSTASQNIIFCFPRTGNNLFQEGQGRIPLERLVREIKQESGVEIPFSRENKFTFENNGFTVRCQVEKARRGKFPMPDIDLQKSAGEAWNHSAHETIRLFNKILTLRPNNVADHVNINTIREAVAALARPMSEVIRNQLMNRNIINRKRKEIEMLKEQATDLRGRLHFSQVVIETEPLEKPQTVCTAPKCVEYVSIGGGMEQPIHKTVCHKDCYLSGVQEHAVANPALKLCISFIDSPNNTCRVCKCSWNLHQHVRWTVKPRTKTFTNKAVEDKISNIEDNKMQAEMVLRSLEIEERERHENCYRLAKSGAKFTVFLKKNCITNHHDAFKEYLDAQIQQEEQNVEKRGVSTDLLIELQAYSREYQNEVDWVTKAQNDGTMPNETAENLLDLIEELKENEQYGQFLRNAQRLEINNTRDHVTKNEVNVIYNTPFSFFLYRN